MLTDDQSMGDLSCMGNPILDTPHIDRLYEQSTRLADFHGAGAFLVRRGSGFIYTIEVTTNLISGIFPTRGNC